MKRTFGPAVAILVLLSACLAGGCDGWDQGLVFSPGEPVGPNQATDASDVKGEWIIILGEYADESGKGDRYTRAKQLQDALTEANWQGVGAIHEQTGLSLVFLGPFEQYKKAQEYLPDVKKYESRDGARPFQLAYIRSMPRPQAGPADLDLRNARGTYTLHVAYFVEPGPAYPETDGLKYPEDWDRREAAVELTKRLRDAGVEAYYYHGPVMSGVTVGTFARDVKYDPRAAWDNPNYRVDSRLANLLAQGEFRYNLLNGQVKVYKRFRLADGRVVKRPRPSHLVEIPSEPIGPASTGTEATEAR